MPEIPKPSKVEKISLDNGNFDLPFFNSKDVPECYCARMARFAAEFIFGKRFPVSNAWDLREKRGVTLQPIDNDTFEFLTRSGIVLPGMIMGLYNKNSLYNKKNRPYTHLGLYIGNKKDRLFFMDQFVDEFRVLTLEDYKRQHFELREAIDIIDCSS
jgi:hypothetical protein